MADPKWGNYAYTGLKIQQFSGKVDQMGANGYRLVDVATYFEKGSRYWTGV